MARGREQVPEDSNKMRVKLFAQGQLKARPGHARRQLVAHTASSSARSRRDDPKELAASSHAPTTAPATSPLSPPAQAPAKSPPRFGYRGAHHSTKDLISPTKRSLAASLETATSTSSPVAESRSESRSAALGGQQGNLAGSAPGERRLLFTPQKELRKPAPPQAIPQGSFKSMAAGASHGEPSAAAKGQPFSTPHAVGLAADQPSLPDKKAHSSYQARPVSTCPATSPPHIMSPTTSPPARKWNQAATPSTNNARSSRGGRLRADTVLPEGAQMQRTPAIKEELPRYSQTPVRGPPPPQHPPESSAEDAPEKQPGEKAEKEDSAPDARVEWKQAAADGQALARMNESEEKRPVPSDALANGARHERAGVSAVEQVANPAEDEVATWHPYAASPETATVAQLAADVKRIRAALSQAEVRNRELGAQLAEALSQLAAPRTANGIETASGIGSASGIDADGLKKAVAGAQAGQVAAEERATRLEDELRLAKQGAQNDPTQGVRLGELAARVLELESELQQHAAALQRESLATGTLRRALAGKEQQLAHVSKEAQSLSEALEVTVDDAEKEREDLVRKLGEAEGLLEEERRESARLEDESARARDASAARVVELRARNTALAHHNAELKLKLEETMGENATAAAEARARIALLEEESGRWRREFTRAERAAAEARAEIAAFKEVNGRLKGELKEAQSVVPEALAQIEELERQLAARGAEVKELAEKVARLESRLAEKTGEVAEGRAQIAALQGEIARQKQEIEEWSQETEKAAADARAKIAALEDEVARAKRQSEESAGRGEKAAAAASDTIAALEAELAERTEEGERMREACVLLESELEEKKEAIDAHANERAIWESELAQKDKEIGTLAAKVGALEKEVLGWEAERAAWQTGGVGSPEKKAGEGAKKQVGSLAEAKLRTDLKRKEDARAALEKKVTDLERDIKAAKLDVQTWEKIGGVDEIELKKEIVKLKRKIHDLEAENAANAAEYDQTMHKRRVKYDLFIADLEQEAAAAKEALRQKGAELNGVDMEREQLSMQVLSLQRMLSGQNGQAPAASSSSSSKPAKVARTLDVRPGPSSPPSTSGTPSSVLEVPSP